MEFNVRVKKRGCYSGASRRFLEAVGDDGREYEIEQTLNGWECRVYRDGFPETGYVFHWAQSARKAAEAINTGSFDPETAHKVIKGAWNCHACNEPTTPKEAACVLCGHIKNMH